MLPFATAPPSRRTVYSPADYVVAPSSSGVKADYYTDGVADDVEINAALTAAAALPNGGTVELRNGTYTTAARIIPPNNTWLRGQNMFATKIMTVTNSTYGIIDNYAEHSAGSPWTNGIISDLQLDGTNMLRSNGKKGVNMSALQNCKIFRVYAHDTTATGLGADDFTGVTITECIVQNCGYTNPKDITAMVYSANTFTVTTATTHGHSIGDTIVVTGMVPAGYNGVFKVTTVVDTFNFTISSSNNSGTLQLPNNPGTATTFGKISDSILGNNGIGIASQSNTAEYFVVTNNICIGNQNNNYLIEADNVGTGPNAIYVFSNNISISGGQCGYRNTGTPNTMFNNNYDYGSLIGCFVGTTSVTKTLTVATWLASVATYTTSTAHGYAVGTYVTIAGVTPSGYNGYYYVTSVPTSTTFTVAIAVDPGGAGTVFGNVQTVVHAVNNTQINNNTFINPTLFGIQIFPHSDGVSARANTIRGAYFYGAYLGAGQGGFTGNTVANCGYDGIEILTGGNYQPLDSLDVSGNIIFNNSVLAASHDGISVTSVTTTPIQNLTIRNNKCFDNQNTATQRYGIIVRSSGNNQNVDVSDNTCYGNTTGPIFMQDTANTVRCYNNSGLNPTGVNALGNKTGSFAIDTITGNFFTMTLTGNATFTFTTSARTIAGTKMTLKITQDGTGSRTATWPANFKKAGGALTLTTTAGATDVIEAIYDGTNFLEVARSLNVS